VPSPPISVSSRLPPVIVSLPASPSMMFLAVFDPVSTSFPAVPVVVTTAGVCTVKDTLALEESEPSETV